MRRKFHTEMREFYNILDETTSLNITFTAQGSIGRQDRSKLIDSPTIYHGTPTGSDLV